MEENNNENENVKENENESRNENVNANENEKQNENENVNSNESDLKSQAKDAIKQAKEEFKKTNVKEQTEGGKNLIKNLISSPIETMKEIINDEHNKYMVLALVIVVIWAISQGLREILDPICFTYYKFSFLGLIKAILSPVLKVFVMTGIIYTLNKGKIKSFMSTLIPVAISRIPLVISSILGLLYYISSKVTYITSPIGSILSIMSTMLLFFAVKESFGEEDNEKALKLFIKIEAIYYIFDFVLSFLGISL